MKLKKILALCLANLALFSTVAFANPPGLTEQVDFGKYFINECETVNTIKQTQGDNWDTYLDKSSDEFDKQHNNISNVLEQQQVYANHQNTYHNGNCRFISATLAKKLTELGFENYELLVLLSTGEYHLTNLYKDYKGEWVVADLFTGINSGLYSQASKQPLNQFLKSLLFQNAKTFYVKNKPLEKFKDEGDQGLINISLFADVYDHFGIDQTLKKQLSDLAKQNPKFTDAFQYPYFLASADQTKITNPTTSLRNKLEQINEDHHLNLNNDQIDIYISKCQQNDNFKPLFMSPNDAKEYLEKKYLSKMEEDLVELIKLLKLKSLK